MRKISLYAAIAWAACLSAQAAQPTAAQMAALNRSLNPTSTPNVNGLDSSFSGAGNDVDAKGNHLFITPGTTPVPTAVAKPTAASLRLTADLRAFEMRIHDSEQSGLISKAQARRLRERISSLKIKFSLDHRPDGAGLSGGQLKRLRSDLDKLTKSI